MDVQKKKPGNKAVAKKAPAQKTDKQYKKEAIAKAKATNKKSGVGGKEAHLRVRKAKVGSKAMDRKNSAKKTDRLLAKEEKLGKKLRVAKAKPRVKKNK